MAFSLVPGTGSEVTQTAGSLELLFKGHWTWPVFSDCIWNITDTNIFVAGNHLTREWGHLDGSEWQCRESGTWRHCLTASIAHWSILVLDCQFEPTPKYWFTFLRVLVSIWTNLCLKLVGFNASKGLHLLWFFIQLISQLHVASSSYLCTLGYCQCMISDFIPLSTAIHNYNFTASGIVNQHQFINVTVQLLSKYTDSH